MVLAHKPISAPAGKPVGGTGATAQGDDQQMLTELTSASSRPATASTPALSVIIPTFNEVRNVPILVARLGEALKAIEWEVIFVDDDSPDGTAEAVRQIARTNPRVRCIRRIGRRGLAGACIEGMLSSSARAVAIMDGDLQHDEKLLPAMLEKIEAGADLAIGSRFVEGGSSEQGFSRVRQRGSAAATLLAQRLFGVTLSDPMSGFFMIDRAAFETLAPKLSTRGFKILLDILASSRGALKVVELPFVFGARQHGESKLDNMVVLEYLGLLLAKLSGDRISIRFILFALVGATGLAVHLLALHQALAFAVPFNWAQTIAAFTAMTWNFFLNNQLTYRDKRLKGFAMVIGLVTFYVVCSVGTVANVGVATWVYGAQPLWWLAGTAGAIMGVVFNYAASSALTWRDA
jgi:dolichol-phosphate mannosyltransferase